MRLRITFELSESSSRLFHHAVLVLREIGAAELEKVESRGQIPRTILSLVLDEKPSKIEQRLAFVRVRCVAGAAKVERHIRSVVVLVKAFELELQNGS